MTFTNKFKDIKKFYIFIIVSIVFFNTILISKLYANAFKINEIEVSEDFDLNFDKKKVFDKAFKLAFIHLASTVITSENEKKIEKTSLLTIKSLIDSFTVIDEKFVKNKYYVKINVNFNKKKTYDFFESKNIFPSIPKKLDVFILPILIKDDQEEIVFFSENPFYNNWNKYNKKFHLLNYVLPTEDIEDRQILNKNIEFIEDYKFEEIIQKYDLKNYIILIINQSNNELNVLSKLQLNNDYKIFTVNYKNANLKNEKYLSELIFHLKNIYEDNWKKLNLINTSIKLPITIFLSSKDYQKIKLFEKTLENLDLVSNFTVLYFNNKDISYKVIYNGAPDKFFSEIKDAGLILEKKDQIWQIQ